MTRTLRNTAQRALTMRRHKMLASLEARVDELAKFLKEDEYIVVSRDSGWRLVREGMTVGFYKGQIVVEGDDK